MVAFVTGAGLGLERSLTTGLGSRFQIGQSPLGQASDDVYVNAFNGNLVVQNTDEVLIGLGPDDVIARTYNSRGTLNDDNGDNWRPSPVRQIVQVSGAPNTAGSVVKRIDWDGSEVAYTYTGGVYVSEDIQGVENTLSYSAGTSKWTWTDSKSRIVEAYDSTGKLLTSTDTDGNKLDFTYDGSNRLSRVTTQSGEYTDLTYNGSGQLTQVTTSYYPPGSSTLSTLTRVRYEYASNRLSSVKVDLSPENNAITDGNYYWTNYGYDAGGRVNSITQKDGSSLTIGYTQVATNDWRVTSLVQTSAAGVTRTTGIAYNLVARTTTITDPASQTTVLTYDASGRLSQVTTALSQVNSFTYSGAEVATVTDPGGKTVTYSYDAKDNLTQIQDDADNLVTYTYDPTTNQLLTETHYVLPGGGTSGGGGGNAAPTATNDSLVVISVADVITFDPRGNDTDPDSDPLSITAVGAASHGTASITGGGTKIIYTRTSAGADSFTYTISDGQGHTSFATVSVADFAGAANTAPTGADDTITLQGIANSLTFDPRGNDTDPEGDKLTITGVSSPTYGTVTIVNGGTAILYSRLYPGADSFTYTIDDGHGHTTNATVTVDDPSLASNTAPTANADMGPTQIGVPRTFDPRWNDVDPDGDFLTIISIGTPTKGTATIVNGGTAIEYTRTITGSESFTYTVSDGQGHTAVGTAMSLMVGPPVNTAPVAHNDTIAVHTSAIFDPRYNELDPDLNPITITAVGTPTKGTVSIVGGGTAIQYTRTSAGTDSFTYTISDGIGGPTTATITVTDPTPPTNVGPAPVGDSLVVNAIGDAITFDPRVNDSDFDADTLTITAVSTPTKGTASIVSGAKITYTRTSAGTDSFTYTVSDGQGHTQVVTVNVGTLSGSGSGGSGGGGPALQLSEIHTTRYSYDSENHLRFIVSAMGYVTEYGYDTQGRRTSSVTYRDNVYDLTGLDADDPIALTALTTWVAAIADRSTVERTDIHYDFRGSIDWTKTYSLASSGGDGLTSQPYTTVTYVYGQAGQLLSRSTSGVGNVETFVYDGLGRITSAVDLNAGTTTTVFNDTARTIAVTLANGLIKTSTYNMAGELISYVESGSGIATATTAYIYDNRGQLRMATDATNRSSYFLYDAVGRKVADIAADGAITEYGYDVSNRLVKTISYVTKVGSTGLTALAAGTATLAGVRPSSNSGDVWSWRVYDNADRLIETIDGKGGVVVFAYDGESHLVSTKSYANVIASGTLTGFKTTTPTTLQLPTADAARDIVSRNFYDNDGRLIGALDGAGYFSQIVYNAAGEKIETIAYANAASAGLRATGTFAQLLASVGADARDEHVRFFYDGRGLLRYTLDANLRPTEYVYATAGHVLHRIDYGAPVGSTSTYTLNYVAGQITSLNLAANADTRTSWSVYDAAGRLAYAIDALGGVTKFSYDSVGQVIKQLRYGTARATSADESLATMDSWATTHASDAGNRISRMVYDKAGRLVYGVDAESYVTEYRYDTAGRATLEVRYALKYTSIGDGITQSGMAALLPGTIPGTAVQKSFSYDTDGRLSDSYDGEGAQTHIVYDALGRVAEKFLAYGTSDEAKTVYTYDTAGRLASETRAPGQGEEATVSYTYDGLGHMLTMVDGRGYTTTYAYDTRGQLASVTRPIDASTTATTSYAYDAFGNLFSTTGPKTGVVSYSIYDALNRLIWTVDAEGYATKTTYTAGGAVASVLHYANKVTGAVTPGVAPTVTANGAEDALTVFEHDKLDRVTKVIDAEGAYEEYTLNAFGDRTAVRGKLGGIIDNAFDKRGLLISESRTMDVYTAAGTLNASSVLNTFEYDARGNRTKMIEADNIASDERTTLYAYDKADRLTTTTHNDVQVVATDLETVSTETPVETITYDKRGNVIETEDATGARTLFYYDDLDRRTAQVTALGTLSVWAYDDNGNATSVKVYGDAVTLPGSPGGTAPSPVNGSNYRETTYVYDRANRLTTTTVAGLRTGAYTSSYATSTGAVTLTSHYDKAGNVICMVDGAGNAAWFYYDKLGRKVAQVDQELYLTTYALDADGNVTTETRYKTKLGSAPAVPPTDTPPSGTSNAADRITNFTYDKNGRRLTESRTGVTAWTVNGASGALTAASTTATVTYTYNGLGEVTRKTEATGDYVAYTYDTFGRQTQVQGSAFTDYTAASVQDTTVQFYDGLNNLVRTVQNTARVTTFTYGMGGRLASTTDAGGYTTSLGYDIAGRVVKQSYTRLKADGTTTLTEASATRYDALGRAVFQAMATWNGTDWVFEEASETTYNVFGEAVVRGFGGLAQETADYDSGGRMWRSTGGDGVVKLFIYDVNGRQTAQVTSDGADLPAGYDWATITVDDAIDLLTNSGANAIGAAAVDGMVVTFTTYDKRGQATGTVEPLRQLRPDGSGGFVTATISHTRTYNAFGEVASQTDSRGYVTDFTYNTMGRIIQTQRPSVSYTSQSGTVSTARPTEDNYYDLAGRLVGTRDANSNLTTRTLLSGAGYGGEEVSTVKEFHPDSGVFTRGYDVFGDLRKTTDEVGKIETYVYDNLGRLTSQVHQTRPANTPGNWTGTAVTLTDYYVYDSQGQRTQHWNSQLGTTYKDLTDYDIHSRLTRMTDMGGNTTTYVYAWDDEVGTVGLGNFGGWVKTTTNAAGLTSTESNDYFGRAVWKGDFGNHGFFYTFDAAGRSVGWAQSWPIGDGQTFTYYNTGLLASSRSISTSSLSGDTVTDDYTANYEYDVEGNRTRETYEVDTTTTSPPAGPVFTHADYQDATVTYDALNRMVTYANTGLGTAMMPLSISWQYDLNSNIRRMQATYNGWSNTGTSSGSQSKDYWYRYDSMNRFVTTEGTLSGGAIVRGTTGHDVTYNLAGQRATATDANGTETYTYTADGYLAQMAMGSAVRAKYYRDAMGRVTDYREYHTDGVIQVYQRTATYNAKSEVTQDVVTVLKPDNAVFVSTTTYDYKADTNNDGDYVDAGDAYLGGVVTHQRTVTTRNGYSDQPTTDTKNTYTWWSVATNYNTYYKPNETQVLTYVSSYSNNNRGQLTSVSIFDGRPRKVTFVNNADGQIILRKEKDNITGQGDPVESHYFFNGRGLGVISNNGPGSDVNYTAAITAHRAYPVGYGAFNNGATTGTQYADPYASYDPINGLNIQYAASRYVVREGDTLQSIAQALWGDGSFWWMIADVNGLNGSEALQAGFSLIVPNKIHNSHNNSSTFKVFNPNELIGDVSPTAQPKPTNKKGCGVIGQIFLAVIAIAVSYLLPMLMPMFGGPLGMVAAAMVGSAVSQGVGVATGLQDKFSWTSVATAGLTAGISGGLKALDVFGKLGVGGAGFLDRVAQGAITNTLTQGVMMATGAQSKFDWTGVAAAGLSSGVGGWVGDKLGYQPGLQASEQTLTNALKGGVSGMAGGMAAAGARSLIEGSNFGDNLMSVMPSVIGNTVGEMIAAGIGDRAGDRRALNRRSDSHETDSVAAALNNSHEGGHVVDNAWAGQSGMNGVPIDTLTVTAGKGGFFLSGNSEPPIVDIARFRINTWGGPVSIDPAIEGSPLYVAETESQPLYGIIKARTYDPSRSNHLTSYPSPIVMVATERGASVVAVPGNAEYEKMGHLERNSDGTYSVEALLKVTYGDSDRGSTVRGDIPASAVAVVHGHIDKGNNKSNGMVDEPLLNAGYGDTRSLAFQNPKPTATVSEGQVGWHVMFDGQLQFIFPVGSMTAKQIRDLQGNIDRQQLKFLRSR